jgi:cation:H+ antiporter
MVLVHLAFLIAGLVLLVKGSDYFVKSASSIARSLGVSDFIIGLTLVAIGTSIPELASSVAASLQQSGGLVVGNVVGSNVANIGLIVGAAAALSVIRTEREMLVRDGYIMLFAALLFLVLVSDGRIGPYEAGAFLLLYIAYVFFLVEDKPKYRGRHDFRGYVRYFLRFGYLARILRGAGAIAGRGQREEGSRDLQLKPLIKDILIICASGLAIVAGAHYLVREAIYIAGLLKVPDLVIGITLIAVGTCLPELTISVSAARKGYGSIVVGNIIGSNIANVFLVLGLSGSIFPLSVKGFTTTITGIFMILLSLLLLFFIRTGWEIRRRDGIVFLALYVFFVVSLVFLVGS